MTFITIDGQRRKADTGEGIHAQQWEDRRFEDAIVGSAMLRDAILKSMGLAPPPPPVRELPPLPKLTPPPELCVASCPLCASPLKKDFERVSTIQQMVAAYYGIQHRSMVSAERRREVSHPRQVAMYLACELTHKPYSEIGRRFGGRDHTTVIHAHKVVLKRMAADANLELDVELLRERLSA